MPESAALITPFVAIRERAFGDGPRPAPAPDDAPADFADAVAATILPRILSMTADDGARIDVMVRNRRVIHIEAVEPSDLWQGSGTPGEASGGGEPDEFARPLARTVLAVAARGSARIVSRLCDGQEPGISTGGHPAAQLSDDIASIRREAVTALVHDFRDDWAGHARAWSDAEQGCDIPEGCAVDAGWMTDRLTEWNAAMASDTPTMRFVLRGGDAPRALALVCAGGASCTIACDAPEDFIRLETALPILRDQLGDI